MSKTVSANLKAELASGAPTIATCWKIERTDGVILGFTDWPDSFTYSALLYDSAGGYERTAIDSKEGLSVDNMNIDGLIDSDAITEEDLLSGKYKNAKIWIFIVSPTNLGWGDLKLDYGTIGEIEIHETKFVAEFRSLTVKLSQNYGNKFSRYCRWELGDTNCGINLASYTVTATVTGLTSDYIFTASSLTQDDDWFKYGIVTWTTGDNIGETFDVKSFASGVITVRQETSKAIQIGDEFTISAGCNHILKMPADVKGSPYTGDCRAKFNNVVNFGGEPELPNLDRVAAVAGSV